MDIDPELRVIDYVKEAAEFVRTADGLVSASAMLERFYSRRAAVQPGRQALGWREEDSICFVC